MKEIENRVIQILQSTWDNVKSDFSKLYEPGEDIPRDDVIEIVTDAGRYKFFAETNRHGDLEAAEYFEIMGMDEQAEILLKAFPEDNY